MEKFEIQINIEGQPETLSVVQNDLKHIYAVYDQGTAIGKVWPIKSERGINWCAEGSIATELLNEIGAQIEAYKGVIEE
jgi:hypothetical protein